MKSILLKIVSVFFIALLFFFASAKFLSVGTDTIEETDVIIVLGYPCTKEGLISSIQKSRVDKGIEIFIKSKAQKILFTGGPAHNKFVESEVMKQYALAKGIGNSDIIVEGKSQNTFENAKFSAGLQSNKSLQYTIVSSHYHTRRARLIFKQHFPKLQVVGANYPSELGLFKRAGAILHEYLGFCYYYTIQKDT